MKVYLAPTVSALILVLFIKFHHATAAPIHTPSGSPYSNAPAGSDIVPPISPHVSPNEKGKGREVLWKDQIEMPPDFIPAGTTLKLRIPSNDAGLDSIVNIVGLMRTAIAGPTWKATADTGASLSAWLVNLKYRIKKMSAVIKIPRGSSISYEHMEGLKDEDLRRRKEEIKEIVEKHNEGKWFKPDKKMREEIYQYIKHPLKKPLKEHKEQRLDIKMPKHFIPEGTDLKLWIPDSNEGRDSVIQITELMRTAVQVGGYPGGIYTGQGLTNWINGLKRRNVLGGKTIPNGPTSPFLLRLTGDDLVKRKKEIEEAVQEHNKGHWFVPDEEMMQDIKEQLSAVPLGSLRRKRPAEAHEPDTGRQRQHIHHQNMDDVHTITGHGTSDQPSMITTLPPAIPHTPLHQEHPSGNRLDVPIGTQLTSQPKMAGMHAVTGHGASYDPNLIITTFPPAFPHTPLHQEHHPSGNPNAGHIGTHLTSHPIDHSVTPALPEDGHSSRIPWDNGHVGMDMGIVDPVTGLNGPQIYGDGALNPHGIPVLYMGASLPRIITPWHNIGGHGYDGALMADHLAHTTNNDQLIHGSYEPSLIANTPVFHHPGQPHDMSGQIMAMKQDHSGHAVATYDNQLMHSGSHELSLTTNTPIHHMSSQFTSMPQDHASHEEGREHRGWNWQ